MKNDDKKNNTPKPISKPNSATSNSIPSRENTFDRKPELNSEDSINLSKTYKKELNVQQSTMSSVITTNKPKPKNDD